jgi:hypothetical protein
MKAIPRITHIRMEPQPAPTGTSDGVPGWVWPPRMAGTLAEGTRTGRRGLWWRNDTCDIIAPHGPCGCVGAAMIGDVWHWEIDRVEAAAAAMGGD